MGQSNKNGQRNPNNPPNPNKGRSMVPVNHNLKYTEQDMLSVLKRAEQFARNKLLAELGITELNSPTGTPSSTWFAAGAEDDFPELVNQERGNLCLGKFTDDEIATMVFMQGDISKEEDMANAIAAMKANVPYYSKIGVVTAGKERIRWLSRHLEKSLREQRAQRTAIWNFVIDEYGSRGEDAMLTACEALGLPREYAMARLHPKHEIKEENDANVT